MEHKISYNHIVIHLETKTDDGLYPSREVWGSYIKTDKLFGNIETDRLVGVIYEFANGCVFMNDQGHPTAIFTTREDLIATLQGLSPSMEWLDSSSE